AGAVLLARQHHQGDVGGAVFLRGGEDAHHLAARQVGGPGPLGAGGEAVFQAHVGEGAAHHHLVVAAPGAVGVEVVGHHPEGLQVLPGGAVDIDGAGGGDVVGGDAVPHHHQAVGADDGAHLRHPGADAVEERRLLDVGGFRPGVDLVGG